MFSKVRHYVFIGSNKENKNYYVLDKIKLISFNGVKMAKEEW